LNHVTTLIFSGSAIELNRDGNIERLLMGDACPVDAKAVQL